MDYNHPAYNLNFVVMINGNQVHLPGTNQED